MVWGLLAGVMMLTSVVAQGPPDLGSVTKPVDQLAGQVLPPALNTLYNATGQNLTREDVRISVNLNFTKGDVNVGGLLVGSGKAEIGAKIHARVELRVISSERIRALLFGENAYNVSSENSSAFSELYIPAEAFRASLTAETAAAFQKAEEAALHDYLAKAVPELDILSLEFAWHNVTPFLAVTDLSLTEPPIVVELDLVLQYIRVESIPSLVNGYFASKADPSHDAKKAEIDRLKRDNGDALRARDFFAAAAYTQLMNLSMQPGWTLDLRMHLPQGYSFTYFNDAVEKHGTRGAELKVDALTSDAAVQKVFLASITQKKAVAFALFVALWVVGWVAAIPGRFLYVRYRVPRLVGPGKP